MRAFIALELPESLTDELAACSRELAAYVTGRFVPRLNYHVTLAFLGEVDEAGAAAAVAALDDACQGLAPIELTPRGLGSFGHGRTATLWMGVAETPQISDLSRRVREQLSQRSLAFDEKPFRPHVTLARRVRFQRETLPALPFPAPAMASRVTLFKSTLTKDGALYKPLYTMELEQRPAASAPR